MSESLKNKTVKGTIWSTIERFSVQGVSFLVMIIMARILTPSDYGLVGMIAVFLAVSQSLVDSGFSQALIRKQNRTETDTSTVFYFNIGIGIVLYMVLFFCAPFIADFYNEPILTPLTRLISVSIIINSFVVVQRALLTVDIDFKTQAKASLSAAVIGGIVGIYLVYAGYGVWSIVWYQLTNLSVNVALLWTLSKWRPKMLYSWSSFRELFTFGSKLAVVGIIDTIYRNIYLIVIGKAYKASDLGYYTRAQQFSEFPSSNLTGILQRVTFPVLCTIQDDIPRLRESYRRLLKASAFIVFPLMLGLAAVAKPMILVVLKEQWLFAGTLLPIICFSMMWYPIHAINLNLLQVRGRSDLFLKLEIIKKAISVLILVSSIPFGIVALCWSSVASSIICLIINTYYTGKLIQLGFCKQMTDLFPILLISCSMGCIVYFTVQLLPLSPWLTLIIGITEGTFIYPILAKISNIKELQEVKSMLKRH